MSISTYFFYKELENEKKSLTTELKKIEYNQDTNTITGNWSSSGYKGIYIPKPLLNEFKSHLTPEVLKLTTDDTSLVPAHSSHQMQYIGSSYNSMFLSSKLLNSYSLYLMSEECNSIEFHEYLLHNYKKISENICTSGDTLNQVTRKLLEGNQDSVMSEYHHRRDFYAKIISIINIMEDHLTESLALRNSIHNNSYVDSEQNINLLCEKLGLESLYILNSEQMYWDCNINKANVIIAFKTHKRVYYIETCSSIGSHLSEITSCAIGSEPTYVDGLELTPEGLSLLEMIHFGNGLKTMKPEFKETDNFTGTISTNLFLLHKKITRNFPYSFNRYIF